MRPLPSARTPDERWLRAVALAGQGEYAEAVELANSLRDPRHHVTLRSMALSFEASTLRQQGGHERALKLDTQALALLDEPSQQDGRPQLALARCDALTGIAADHIGLGQLDRTRESLAQLPPLFDGADAAPFGWRARMRWRWVSAEAAMAAGDKETGRVEALAAQDLARTCPSLRHRVKSHLVFAASIALPISEAGTRERVCANEVFQEAQTAGLVPLAWAAAMLLHAIEPDEGWDKEAEVLRGQWT